MGRTPCSERRGLKKGPWSPEEDQILINYIQKNGHGSWRALPELAGLTRCGKSCRLRWTNYLRPDIKRGSFTEEEGRTIIQLHGIVGNRWSVIASQLPGRTDNEIKNFWNTHLKKRLLKMGLDPSTHKPIEESNPNAPQGYEAVKRHKAQWENARLQAEARLSRESLIISSASNYHTNSSRVEMPNNNPPADYFLKMWNSETGKAFRRENDHPNIGRGDDPLLSSEIRVSLVSSEKNSCGQSLHPNKKENDKDKDKDNSSQHCKIGDCNVETREVPSCVAYMTEDQATEELDFLGLPLDFLDTDDNNGNIESESRRNFEEQAASSWAELLDEDYWSNM